jgi:hypothetical protein
MRDSTARKLEDLGLSVRARQRPKILYKHSPDIRRCWTFCCWDCPPSETEAGRIETRLNITNNNNNKKKNNQLRGHCDFIRLPDSYWKYGSESRKKFKLI